MSYSSLADIPKVKIIREFLKAQGWSELDLPQLCRPNTIWIKPPSRLGFGPESRFSLPLLEESVSDFLPFIKNCHPGERVYPLHDGGVGGTIRRLSARLGIAATNPDSVDYTVINPDSFEKDILTVIIVSLRECQPVAKISFRIGRISYVGSILAYLEIEGFGYTYTETEDTAHIEINLIA